MDDWYYNEEDALFIRCPYCGAEYEPSYDDTYIGGKCVDCYTEDNEQEFTCDDCGKRFTVTPYLAEWRYKTETIDGEMTEQEHEQL